MEKVEQKQKGKFSISVNAVPAIASGERQRTFDKEVGRRMAEERKPKRKLAETQKILEDQGIKTGSRSRRSSTELLAVQFRGR